MSSIIAATGSTVASQPVRVLPSLLTMARGSYQRDLLTGYQRWSGSDIKGKWGGRYRASRHALLARIVNAGFDVRIGGFKNANNRIMSVLIVEGEIVSATS